MVFFKNYYMDPAMRQNFAYAFAETYNLNLEVCLRNFIETPHSHDHDHEDHDHHDRDPHGLPASSSKLSSSSPTTNYDNHHVKTTCLVFGSFLDTFQRIADSAANTRGSQSS